MTSRPAAPPRPRPAAAELLRRTDTLDVVRGAAAALALLSPLLPGLVPGAGLVGVVVFFAVSGYLAAGVALLGPRDAASGRALLAPALLLVLAAYVVAALLGVAAALAGLVASVAPVPFPLPFPGLPLLPVPSALWVVVPLVLLVGSRPGRAQLALAVAAVAAALGTLAWVGGAAGGVPLPSTSWAWCFVLGAALRWADQRRARLPR